MDIIINYIMHIMKVQLHNYYNKKDKKINFIEQLLNITKTEFKSFGLNSKEIQHIEAKAELEGFKLRGSL